MQAGASNVELPQSNFVDLVKSLQNDAEEREHFFQVCICFFTDFGILDNNAI